MKNRIESEQLVASHMRTSRAGLAIIKAFEGFRPQYRQLPDGRWTIGYGHVRRKKEGVRVTEREAEAILREYDLPPVERLVLDSVLAPLNQNEFDALVSLAFNIGPEAFAKSDVVAFLNSGNRLAAASGFDSWRQSTIGGRVQILDVLVRRRAAEKALFLRAPGSVRAASSLFYRPVEDRDGLLAPPDKVERLDAPVDEAEKAKPLSLVPPAAPREEKIEQAAPAPAETPAKAAEAVRERLVRILGEDGSKVSKVAAKPTPDRTSPEEIAEAVSELVADSEANGPRKSVWPERPQTLVDDEIAETDEPDEIPDVLDALEDDARRDDENFIDDVQDPDWTYKPEVLPSQRGDQALGIWAAMPYALLTLIGAGLFAFGLAEQNGIVESDATILSEYQVWMPLLMMLVGVLLFATMAYYTYRALLDGEEV